MFAELRSALRPALVLLGLFTLLTGLAYPLLVTGVAQGLFPHQANGSLIEREGRVVGSELIGQGFASPRHFQGRPSAAGKGHDASASAGSNLAPGSKDLRDRIAADVARLRGEGVEGPIPADLVTASGSGLDPHISPASARLQAPRIARERGLAPAAVLALIDARVESEGLLGEPRVNVLALNIALDAAAPPATRAR